MANAVDKEQIEMLSQWWKNYGSSIVITLVIVLGVIFGWRYWDQAKTKHRTEASNLYQSLFSAATLSNPASANETIITLKNKFADTPYATLGAMISARLDVDSNNLSAALTELQWVIQNSKLKNFQQLARINSARLLLEQKQYPQALQMLVVVNDPSFQPMIDDVRGEIYAAQNDLPNAKLAFSAAKAGFQEVGMSDALPTLQLNSIE